MAPSADAADLAAERVDHEMIRLHLPRDERLAQPEGGVDDRFAQQPGQRVGGEQHARDLARHHPLHDTARAASSCGMALRTR